MIKIAICRKKTGAPIKRDIVKDVITRTTGKETPILYLRILKRDRNDPTPR